MNNILNDFYSYRYGIPDSIGSICFEYFQTRNNRSLKMICFVEGKTDAEFYRGYICRIKALSNIEIKFIYNDEGSNNRQGGKESVLNICRYLCDEIGTGLDNCMFIIDRDYDNSEIYEKRLSVSSLSHLTRSSMLFV